jgi:subtilisin family serine protease
LVALRVGTADTIPTSNIELALRWVIDNRTKFNISVVNLSLGSGNYVDPETDSLSDEFATLRAAGVFVVAASGNSNDANTGPISQDGIASPAADPNVFAVASVTASDVITTWSQRGDELDLLAPGEGIVVPTLTGTYTTVNGTSFSAPYVAGTASLIKQANPFAKAGDIGSILMSSASLNRDGDAETGNTTGLAFARLNIDQALRLVGQRIGRTTTLAMGRSFDTALDSQGVLHTAFYDTTQGRLLYATRDTDGLWSRSYIVDATADVGVQVSIAVDHTGKVGIAYFDLTNTAVKYAGFNGVNWSVTTIESDKHTGSDASIAFDIDANAYVSFYRRSGGQLRLATLDRDQNTWSVQIVDGSGATNLGAYTSIDVGEAEFVSGGFTVYDTTIAIAYADVTNGNLKYARIDIDAPTPAWFIATVDDTDGVSSISLNLHAGPLNLGLQAQIGYVDSSKRLVKYAYRNDDWFVEVAASSGKYGTNAQLFFDDSDNPRIAYFHGIQRATYISTRSTSGNWSLNRVTPGSGGLSVAQNGRIGTTILSYLDRARQRLYAIEL